MTFKKSNFYTVTIAAICCKYNLHTHHCPCSSSTNVYMIENSSWDQQYPQTHSAYTSRDIAS